MRVTKIGIKPSERLWKGTCYACKSEFEAYQHEIQSKIEHDARENTSFVREKCTICDNNLFLQLV